MFLKHEKVGGRVIDDQSRCDFCGMSGFKDNEIMRHLYHHCTEGKGSTSGEKMQREAWFSQAYAAYRGVVPYDNQESDWARALGINVENIAWDTVKPYGEPRQFTYKQCGPVWFKSILLETRHAVRILTFALSKFYMLSEKAQSLIHAIWFSNTNDRENSAGSALMPDTMRSVALLKFAEEIECPCKTPHEVSESKLFPICKHDFLNANARKIAR